MAARQGKQRNARAKVPPSGGQKECHGILQMSVLQHSNAVGPNIGEFADAVVLKRFGDVPEDLSEL
jgi:hypothetical protein